MMVAQIPEAGADFEIVEREIPNPGRDTCASRCKPVAFATVMCLRKKAPGPEFNIIAFQGTKSRASSMNWALMFPGGKRDSASVSAGTAARTIPVPHVGAEIFAMAET